MIGPFVNKEDGPYLKHGRKGTKVGGLGPFRMEAITLRLEAIASRLEAIAVIRLEAIANRNKTRKEERSNIVCYSVGGPKRRRPSPRFAHWRCSQEIR